jgi:tetratricopeptide (TPR) repeat protein
MRHTFAVLLVLSLTSPSWGQDQQTITLPPLEAAKLLIQMGELDGAQEVLDQMFRISGNDTEALFLQGQVYGLREDWKNAVATYRKILSDRPDLTRVRLELARALYFDSQYSEALYHFRLALATPDLPENVIKNINTFIGNIYQKRDWQLGAGLSVVGSTNINQAPSTGTVNILGLPFNLNRSAQAQPGVGAAFAVNGEYDFRLDDTTKLRNLASFYTVQYGGRNFSDMIVSYALGPQMLRQGWDASFLGVFVHRLYSNDPYSDGYGPRVETNWNVSDRWRLENEIEYLWRTWHEPNNFLNGWSYDDTLTTLYSLSPTSSLRLITGVGHDKSRSSEWSDWFYHVGVGYHREVAWGLTFDIQPEFYHFKYDGVQPLFGIKRSDDVARGTLSVYKRDWYWAGFTPVLSYVYTQDWSNVTIYSYTQHQLQIGITRQF